MAAHLAALKRISLRVRKKKPQATSRKLQAKGSKKFLAGPCEKR